MSETQNMTGGEAMLRAAVANGIDTVFGLPGAQVAWIRQRHTVRPDRQRLDSKPAVRRNGHLPNRWIAHRMGPIRGRIPDHHNAVDDACIAVDHAAMDRTRLANSELWLA